MILSVILLVVGFGFNLASAFTSAFSRLWGRRGGQLATILLRDVVGIPAWLAGLALAVRTSSPRSLDPPPALSALGWCLIVAGALLVFAALRVLGRPAAAPSTSDTLIERGPYRLLRHPIHVGTFLEFLGLALLRPTVPVLLACTLGTIWLLLQSRLEEVDLTKRIPEYRLYSQRVPPFLPRLRPRGGKRA